MVFVGEEGGGDWERQRPLLQQQHGDGATHRRVLQAVLPPGLRRVQPHVLVVLPGLAGGAADGVVSRPPRHVQSVSDIHGIRESGSG